MASPWIAEMRVVFVHPNGKRAPGNIAIAAPAPEEDFASCAYALDGLEPPSEEGARKIGGEDNLQALLLVVRFVGMRLHHFLGRGGRIVYAESEDEGDTDVPLEAIFGPLMKDNA